MADNQIKPSESVAEITDSDIIFECAHCGKSLAIDYRGAGLKIQCPECSQEIQVPIPEGMEIHDIDQAESALQEAPSDSDTGHDLTSELQATRDQIRTLVTELEELRFRRRNLEKHRSETTKWIHSITRQMGVIRNALDQIDEILKNFGEKSPDDTQKLG